MGNKNFESSTDETKKHREHYLKKNHSKSNSSFREKISLSRSSSKVDESIGETAHPHKSQKKEI